MSRPLSIEEFRPLIDAAACGPPTVRILAAHSKNKRTDELPLHRAVAEQLMAWLATKNGIEPDAPLFPLQTASGHWRKTGKMMRPDLKRAGLPYQDEDGLFADFHANRHTFITNLGKASVPLTTRQKLARHSDPKLTANVYTHVGLTEKVAAIESLVALPGTRSESREAAALGRDDLLPCQEQEQRCTDTVLSRAPGEALAGTGSHKYTAEDSNL